MLRGRRNTAASGEVLSGASLTQWPDHRENRLTGRSSIALGVGLRQHVGCRPASASQKMGSQPDDGRAECGLDGWMALVVVKARGEERLLLGVPQCSSEASKNTVSISEGAAVKPVPGEYCLEICIESAGSLKIRVLSLSPTDFRIGWPDLILTQVFQLIPKRPIISVCEPTNIANSSIRSELTMHIVNVRGRECITTSNQKDDESRSSRGRFISGGSISATA